MYKLAFRSINIALLEKYGDNASIQIAQMLLDLSKNNYKTAGNKLFCGYSS